MRDFFITDKAEMEAIIHRCSYCSVAILDSVNQVPYVIPMNFGYEDGVIILHSAPEGKKVNFIEHNNKVSMLFCVEEGLRCSNIEVACSYSMEGKSVLCEGEVSFVEDLEEKERCLNILMKKYSVREFKYSEPALRNVKVWKVLIRQISARAVGQNYRHHL